MSDVKPLQDFKSFIKNLEFNYKDIRFEVMTNISHFSYDVTAFFPDNKYKTWVWGYNLTIYNEGREWIASCIDTGLLEYKRSEQFRNDMSFLLNKNGK